MNILEQWETFKVYIRLKKQGNKTQSWMAGCETDTNIRKKIYSCDTFLVFLLNQKKKKKLWYFWIFDLFYFLTFNLGLPETFVLENLEVSPISLMVMKNTSLTSQNSKSGHSR